MAVTKPKSFESITSEEYAKRYEPVNGFFLCEKLLTPPKTSGGIHLPQGTIDGSNQWKGAAVVLKKSRTLCEAAWDQYMMDLLEVGSIVGFGATTSRLAPAPAHYQFVNPENQPDRTVTLHATDIMGFIFESAKDQEKFFEREAEARQIYTRRIRASN